MKISAARANRQQLLLPIVIAKPAIDQGRIIATHCAFAEEGNMAHDFTSKSQFLRAQKTQTFIQ